jgi:ribosomal protein S18 acetylase RimI-like enzyme
MNQQPQPSRADADAAPFIIRLATADDIAAVDWLDRFGTSPHRNLSNSMTQYFGSVDPSVHERNLIFLAELRPDVATDLPQRVAGKVELLLAPATQPSEVGYIKRVVVHPAWRQHGVARAILEHIIQAAPSLGVQDLDLHVWEGNTAALHLYEALGFAERHRELYLRLTLGEPGADDAESSLAERTAHRDQPSH